MITYPGTAVNTRVRGSVYLLNKLRRITAPLALPHFSKGIKLLGIGSPEMESRSQNIQWCALIVV